MQALCWAWKRRHTHVQRYLKPLLKKIEDGEIDPSFLITHRVTLEDGPDAYGTFRDQKDGSIKVVMRPNGRKGCVSAAGLR